MRLSLASSTAQSIALVVVVAWALAAVFMLTRTLVSARAIDEQVVTITEEVGGVDADLDFVALARETDELAQQIDTAAAPLSGQLAQVVEAARGIDASVASIDDTAASINDNVTAIEATAGSINDTVVAINGNARSINDTVNEINANARSIGGSVDGILGNFTGVLGVVRSINGDETAPLAQDLGVSGINRRADVVIDLVTAIGDDTGNILAVVRDDVVRHANSIDCSELVQTSGAVGSGGDACRE